MTMTMTIIIIIILTIIMLNQPAVSRTHASANASQAHHC